MFKLFLMSPEVYKQYRELKRCISDMFSSKGIGALEMHYRSARGTLSIIYKLLCKRINDNN